MSMVTEEMAITAEFPRIDPRMRDRWVSTRRAEGRRRLRVAVALAAVVTLAGGAFGALESPLFSVAHVTVSGARHESVAQVRATAGLTAHQPLIGVDTAVAAQRLNRLPWVASAVVARRWPDSVAVHLVERVAVAQVAVAGARQAQIDATGRVLSVVDTPMAGLVGLVGIGPVGAPGTWLPGTGTDAAGTTPDLLALCALVPPPLGADLSLMRDVGGVLTAVVVTPAAAVGDPPGSSGVPVMFGDASQLTAKVQALETIVDQVALTGIAGIDLRVPGRPVLTGTPSHTNVSSTAGG